VPHTLCGTKCHTPAEFNSGARVGPGADSGDAVLGAGAAVFAVGAGAGIGASGFDDARCSAKERERNSNHGHKNGLHENLCAGLWKMENQALLRC